MIDEGTILKDEDRERVDRNLFPEQLLNSRAGGKVGPQDGGGQLAQRQRQGLDQRGMAGGVGEAVADRLEQRRQSATGTVLREADAGGSGPAALDVGLGEAEGKGPQQGQGLLKLGDSEGVLVGVQEGHQQGDVGRGRSPVFHGSTGLLDRRVHLEGHGDGQDRLPRPLLWQPCQMCGNLRLLPRAPLSLLRPGSASRASGRFRRLGSLDRDPAIVRTTGIVTTRR